MCSAQSLTTHSQFHSVRFLPRFGELHFVLIPLTVKFLIHLLLKFVPRTLFKIYATCSQVKEEHFYDLIFLIFAIVTEKFDVKVFSDRNFYT